VRLDTRDSLGSPHRYKPVMHPIVKEVCASAPWSVTSQHHFAESSHVNLQEINEVRVLMRRLANSSFAPSRNVVFVDSSVALEALSKGRSSSFCINGLARKTLLFCVIGQKNVNLLWVDSASNPADDPSRFVCLRRRVVARESFAERCVGQPMFSGGLKAFVASKRLCREVGGENLCLSQALSSAGLLVARPVPFTDICQTHVINNIEQDIITKVYIYLHFGLTCTFWGRCTHRVEDSNHTDFPCGNTSQQSAYRSMYVGRIIKLVICLLQHHCLFTIECPGESDLEFQEDIRKLITYPGCRFLPLFPYSNNTAGIITNITPCWWWSGTGDSIATHIGRNGRHACWAEWVRDHVLSL
jgi:hypothetical protein